MRHHADSNTNQETEPTGQPSRQAPPQPDGGDHVFGSGYDAFVVIIDSDGKQQMVYKHAISTIIPERPLSWDSEEGDAE